MSDLWWAISAALLNRQALEGCSVVMPREMVPSHSEFIFFILTCTSQPHRQCGEWVHCYNNYDSYKLAITTMTVPDNRHERFCTSNTLSFGSFLSDSRIPSLNPFTRTAEQPSLARRMFRPQCSENFTLHTQRNCQEHNQDTTLLVKCNWAKCMRMPTTYWIEASKIHSTPSVCCKLNTW